MDDVAILGAGVAGLTAAHELAARGFKVTVYERLGAAGGKARSFDGPSLGGDGTEPRLPAEHGFRFFPGFYKHVFDTMSRIPTGRLVRSTVMDQLKYARRIDILQADDMPLVYATQLWRVRGWMLRPLTAGWSKFFHRSVGFSGRDTWWFMLRLWELLRSCRERRFAEYEYRDWWEYSGAQRRQADPRYADDRDAQRYVKMMAAMTRSLVAARADELSVRTGGFILLQLQLAMVSLLRRAPRVLSGPTSDVWITPWVDYLKRTNRVDFEWNHNVTAIHCKDRKIESVTVEHDGNPKEISARCYIAALPVEVMRDLVTAEMAAVDPGLAHDRLCKLTLRWMNGVMIYLRGRDKDNNFTHHGHTIYIDSPWALTSISQVQFWQRRYDPARLGGEVRSILSVCVSDWDTNGVLYNKPAKDCNEREIKTEVLEQLRMHLRNTKAARALDDANIVAIFIDPAIRQPNEGRTTNTEPLLINTPYSWDYRPGTRTKIPNLFLASDYVRTYTDLATMEGANEAARRAVNGVLTFLKSTEPPCKIWRLHEPMFSLALSRWCDRDRLRFADNEAFTAAASLWDELHADGSRVARARRQ